MVGRDVDELTGDLGLLSRDLIGDSQLRWLGPEKGVMHMAIGAVVNAVWDLAARRAGQPLWRFLADLTPEQLVDAGRLPLPHRRAHAGRGAGDPAAPAEAGAPSAPTAAAPERLPGLHHLARLARLRRRQAGPARRGGGRRRLHPDQAQGRRRPRRRRPAHAASPATVVGPDVAIAIDANQRWDVGEAIDWVSALAPFDPCWIEEPTSPDDILGHAGDPRRRSPVPVATGEHVQNRVMFKQLLQAEAVDVVQIDAGRVGGVNENLAILLLAAKFGVPVCPHAGGVGLCELVQHLAMFDYVAVSGTLDGRVIEYVDHLHEHFADPARDPRRPLPRADGARLLGRACSTTRSTRFRFPDGAEWPPAHDWTGAA